MILDTNALSALIDGDETLAARLTEVQFPAITVITLGEYRYGIRGVRSRAAYEAWLDEHLPEFELLPVEEKTARAYADLKQELRFLGRPIPENDIWISALARQHRLTVLTRDRHFSFVPNLDVKSW